MYATLIIGRTYHLTRIIRKFATDYEKSIRITRRVESGPWGKSGHMALLFWRSRRLPASPFSPLRPPPPRGWTLVGHADEALFEDKKISSRPSPGRGFFFTTKGTKVLRDSVVGPGGGLTQADGCWREALRRFRGMGRGYDLARWLRPRHRQSGALQDEDESFRAGNLNFNLRERSRVIQGWQAGRPPCNFRVQRCRPSRSGFD